MLNTNLKYSYNDIAIVPTKMSRINSRSEAIVDPLPIFTAPMTSVVDENNFKLFHQKGITPIIPRSVNLFTRAELMNKGKWVALSLKEFKALFIDEWKDRTVIEFKICIDIANGHMEQLYDLCKEAKYIAAHTKNYNLTIMVGNIANPSTIKFISELNEHNSYHKSRQLIDYVRVGIGGGSGCTTSSNVGVHYPMASLIDECRQYKNEFSPKIIADGGIRGYADVIKALALGADYVMIGSLFAQCIESAGLKFLDSDYRKNIPVSFKYNYYKDLTFDGTNWKGYYSDEYKEILRNKHGISEDIPSYGDEKVLGPIRVKFFGMASADGQKAIQGKKTKTAEGITKNLPVIYSLNKWVDNMRDYLRSAMSYTGAFTLKDFICNTNTVVISNNTKNSINA